MVRRPVPTQALLGSPVCCDTPYGPVCGVVIGCTSTHLWLAPLPGPLCPAPRWTYRAAKRPPGHWAAAGWNLAVPLAAILGISALSVYWW
ncbi:MAG: hypothetical protein K6T26_01895 [Alicyclobacillus sp.]|nr:hypothetical protein [Alicyclobacillus sp.]